MRHGLVKETRTALITGVTGQDGSYLAELLISKGYEVHGTIVESNRASGLSALNPGRNGKIALHVMDISDRSSICAVLGEVKPDEIYNLAAKSSVMSSFNDTERTGEVTALGVARIIDCIRELDRPTKLYQASSSEMFGASRPKQDENTHFAPRNPYACAKLYAHWMVRNFRDGYGKFACNGILFNHESPRRGEQFVTRKITMGVARILNGSSDPLRFGNLNAMRDWGFAPEYVEAMWRMLQTDTPDDYVIGTGESHSVREFLLEAFRYADLDIDRYVTVDPDLFRPTETSTMVANYDKARTELGWEPRVRFKELVRIMVDSDMRRIGLEPIGEGDEILRRLFPHKWWCGD